MFSKTSELAGLTLLAYGIGLALGTAAGLMAGGLCLLLLGIAIDDAAVKATLNQGLGWVRYAWFRQLAKESGLPVPSLRSVSVPTGWVRCGCGGEEECPVCGGTGFIPDPELRVNSRSPHPPIQVDPQTQELGARLAQSRTERSKVGDRTPALSRQDNLERIG